MRMWIDPELLAPHKAAVSANPAKIQPIVFLGLPETIRDPTTAYTSVTTLPTTRKVQLEPFDRGSDVAASEIAATANRTSSATIIARDTRRAIAGFIERLPRSSAPEPDP